MVLIKASIKQAQWPLGGSQCASQHRRDCPARQNLGVRGGHRSTFTTRVPSMVHILHLVELFKMSTMTTLLTPTVAWPGQGLHPWPPLLPSYNDAVANTLAGLDTVTF